MEFNMARVYLDVWNKRCIVTKVALQLLCGRQWHSSDLNLGPKHVFVDRKVNLFMVFFHLCVVLAAFFGGQKERVIIFCFYRSACKRLWPSLFNTQGKGRMFSACSKFQLRCGIQLRVQYFSFQSTIFQSKIKQSVAWSTLSTWKSCQIREVMPW